MLTTHAFLSSQSHQWDGYPERNFDELVALYNITIKLYTLSSVETAEEAQEWLYDLPATYIRRLQQAGMLREEAHRERHLW